MLKLRSLNWSYETICTQCIYEFVINCCTVTSVGELKRYTLCISIYSNCAGAFHHKDAVFLIPISSFYGKRIS